MKIMITGATGYVGHSLALELAKQGNLVHVLVRDTHSVFIPNHPNIRLFKGDITNLPSIKRAMQDCEQVYHTAALVKFWEKDPTKFYKANVDGTNNILASALESGVKKLVFTSSCGVIGSSIGEPLNENDPRISAFDNDYELTKFIAENMVKQYAHKGLSTVIVSLSKVFGPGIETHPISVNRAIKHFIEGDITFIPLPASYISNYCFIDDVVKGHILAMKNGISGEKYILGGENISYLSFFTMLREISHVKTKLVQAPRLAVHLVVYLQWIKYKLTNADLFFTAKAIRHIYCNKAFSSQKAIDYLGYHFTPLKTALEKTVHFLKTNQHEQ